MAVMFSEGVKLRVYSRAGKYEDILLSPLKCIA